jgi:2-polyprenyl-6-methoxyphenol hydroxylase-like FAD-dependent oxidoreductase
MSSPPVLVAGAGIGGLALALTLHEIGVPCLILEAVPQLKPLGVGINLQPNAVRELYEMGFGPGDLDEIGVRTREFALVGLNGKDVYAEPRGLEAGYRWPQYSVHRGGLQMMLYRATVERMGDGAVRTGTRVTGYRNQPGGVKVQVESRAAGRQEIDGALLIGADGLHSAVRAQMHPDQPPIQWGGAIMWRGVTRGTPIRTGASFVGFGTHRQRVVFYPISRPDPASGLAAINWLAEIFLHHFERWTHDWLDVPGMLRGAADVYEYPMIDRDPVPTWVDGRVALLGDAAHVMYPTGSNGGSQAIIDARVLGSSVLAHGVTPAALQDYDARLCKDVSALVLRNRGAGPFGLLNLLDERCGGVFDDIEKVIPRAERDEFMRGYRSAAGFAMEKLNASPPILARGAGQATRARG